MVEEVQQDLWILRSAVQARGKIDGIQDADAFSRNPDVRKAAFVDPTMEFFMLLKLQMERNYGDIFHLMF